ncbi:hypothetical protein L6452_20684 [Arctium lappa]|uniref:Uncharacterized protein n=1 Tax=Arctium lappa TaxID=4217 RepID=A0ACB9BBM4_ARCLA|nr:hypothetical protein L6452_20684 [Arctium lappa]
MTVAKPYQLAYLITVTPKLKQVSVLAYDGSIKESKQRGSDFGRRIQSATIIDFIDTSFFFTCTSLFSHSIAQLLRLISFFGLPSVIADV